MYPFLYVFRKRFAAYCKINARKTISCDSCDSSGSGLCDHGQILRTCHFASKTSSNLLNEDEDEGRQPRRRDHDRRYLEHGIIPIPASRKKYHIDAGGHDLCILQKSHDFDFSAHVALSPLRSIFDGNSSQCLGNTCNCGNPWLEIDDGQGIIYTSNRLFKIGLKAAKCSNSINCKAGIVRYNGAQDGLIILYNNSENATIICSALNFIIMSERIHGHSSTETEYHATIVDNYIAY